MTDLPLQKIVFALEQDEDGYPPVAYEHAWAKSLGEGRFEIDSIPFFARQATLGDVVSVVPGDGELRFGDVLERSQSSLLRVVYFRGTDPEEIRRALADLGCATELNDVHRLIAISVPTTVSLEDVQSYLDSGSEGSRWEYEEPILRHPA